MDGWNKSSCSLKGTCKTPNEEHNPALRLVDGALKSGNISETLSPTPPVILHHCQPLLSENHHHLSFRIECPIVPNHLWGNSVHHRAVFPSLFFILFFHYDYFYFKFKKTLLVRSQYQRCVPDIRRHWRWCVTFSFSFIN